MTDLSPLEAKARNAALAARATWLRWLFGGLLIIAGVWYLLGPRFAGGAAMLFGMMIQGREIREARRERERGKP